MEKAKIQNICHYHYFKPEETGYRTWEFQGNGHGNLIPYQPQDFHSSYDILLPSQDGLSPKTTNHLMKEKGRNVTTKMFAVIWSVLKFLTMKETLKFI